MTSDVADAVTVAPHGCPRCSPAWSVLRRHGGCSRPAEPIGLLLALALAPKAAGSEWLRRYLDELRNVRLEIRFGQSSTCSASTHHRR